MDRDETIEEVEFLNWEEEDYSLQVHFENDASFLLGNEVDRNGCATMSMLDKKTPIKECTEPGHHILNIRGEFDSTDTTKVSENCKESSLHKRRTMLHYDIDNADDAIDREQFSSAALHPEIEGRQYLSNGFSESTQRLNGFLGDGYVNNEALVHHGDIDMYVGCSEMVSCEAFEGQIDASEYCNAPCEQGLDKVLDNTTPSPRIKFKGRKSGTTDAIKTSTSVTYPFAFIKPSGVQGDITLNDINQHIHSLSYLHSNMNHMNDGDPWLCFPISTISGKPIVAKTKVRTEGGKGSIIITRTKG